MSEHGTPQPGDDTLRRQLRHLSVRIWTLILLWVLLVTGSAALAVRTGSFRALMIIPLLAVIAASPLIRKMQALKAELGGRRRNRD